MNSPLSPLYKTAEILAGLSMIMIFLLVGGGVVLRLMGLQLAGNDDLASYGLVGTLFLALAPTYRRNEHIRVGLLIERLGAQLKQRLEVFLVVASTVATGWATWWLARMVYDSLRFGDVAQGLLAVPLWIPQLAMPVGAAILLIALLEDLLRCLVKRAPSYVVAAENDTGETHFER